jgi:lipoic acid synthetase
MRSRLFSSLGRPLTRGPSLEEFLSKSAENLQKESLVSDRLPAWLKTPIAVGEKYTKLKDTLRGLKLHTVRNTRHLFTIIQLL